MEVDLKKIFDRDAESAKQRQATHLAFDTAVLEERMRRYLAMRGIQLDDGQRNSQAV